MGRRASRSRELKDSKNYLRTLHFVVTSTLESCQTPIECAIEVISSGTQDEESFYIVDLQNVNDTIHRWRDILPDVQPYYAVKCNPDNVILQTMADFGTSFDCASPNEIRRVLEMGIDSSHILYANPTKRIKDLKYAWENGVRITTLDALGEIDKIADTCPGMSVLVRIYANDPHAQCCLSNKFGAHPDEWDSILRRLVERGMNMAGVSFHVGSGASTPSAFTRAVAAARACIDEARALGLNPSIVDIGGGFVSNTFDVVGATVREALAAYFPPSVGCAFIAEPGRLFVEHCAHLVTPIIGKRVVDDRHLYYIGDGIYGSFNCILYDHAKVALPTLVRCSGLAPSGVAGVTGVTYESDVFGPTCDGLDMVLRSVELPEAAVGDWWIFPSMGAYTIAGASCFNGIPFFDIRTHYMRVQVTEK